MQAGDARLVLASCPAHRPGADALAGQHPLSHGDLLSRGSLVGRRGVLAAAVAKPGLLSELQSAGAAAIGARAPNPVLLTRCDGRPVGPALGGRGRGGVLARGRAQPPAGRSPPPPGPATAGHGGLRGAGHPRRNLAAGRQPQSLACGDHFGLGT